MAYKLTLSVAEAVVARARASLAELGGDISLSALVEAYLVRVSAEGSGMVTVATPEELQAVRDFKGRVIPVPASARRACAHMDNGWFVIAQGRQSDPAVVLALDAIRRGGHQINHEIEVPVDLLERLNGLDNQVNQEASRDRLLSLLGIAATKGACEMHVVVARKFADVSLRVGSRMMHLEQMDPVFARNMMRQVVFMGKNISAHHGSTENQEIFLDRNRFELPGTLSSVGMSFLPSGDDGRAMIAKLDYGYARAEPLSLQSLGFSDEHVEIIRKGGRRPCGLSIVSGPERSERDRTMAAILAEIRQGDEHTGMSRSIMGVGIPLQYATPGMVNHPIEVHAMDGDGSEGFHIAMKNVILTHPDILVSGAIRGASGARMALQAATTGMSVWSVLSATSIKGAIDRLRLLVSPGMHIDSRGTLNLVIHQRLVRTLCPHCRLGMRESTDPQAWIWMKKFSPIRELAAYEANPVGCSACVEGHAGETVVAAVHDMSWWSSDSLASIQTHEELKGVMVGGAFVEFERPQCPERIHAHALSKIAAGILSARDVIDQVGD